MIKIIALGAIFLGESLSIVAELIASKRFTETTNHFAALWPMYLLITLGGVLLVTGYVLGYMHLRNIWIIVAISVGSILVVEPVLTWLLFREVPTTGAFIGLVLGAAGTLAAIFLK